MTRSKEFVYAVTSDHRFCQINCRGNFAIYTHALLHRDRGSNCYAKQEDHEFTQGSLNVSGFPNHRMQWYNCSFNFHVGKVSLFSPFPTENSNIWFAIRHGAILYGINYPLRQSGIFRNKTIIRQNVLDMVLLVIWQVYVKCAKHRNN